MKRHKSAETTESSTQVEEKAAPARYGRGGPAAPKTAKGGGRGNGVPEVKACTPEELLAALRELQMGDFSVRLPEDGDPLMVEIAHAFNGIAQQNEAMMHEVMRVSTTVGREGQMTDRATLTEVSGGWRSEIDAINSLITDLMQPTTEVARVLTAVARGDLSQKMVLEIEGKSVQGEFLRIGMTVNTLVDQLSSFASEVTRVAREVGTDGKLGGQAGTRRSARAEGDH